MRISLIFCIILVLLAASVITTVQLSYIGLFTTVPAIVLLVVFYRSIMKPIRSITNGADLLKQQDFSSRLAHVNQPEADKIIDMFNSMMSTLRDERLNMREQNHFLDLLIAVSPLGILIIDNIGRIVTANNAAATFLGYKNKESATGMLLGKLDSQLGQQLARLRQGETNTVRLNDSMIYRCSKLQFMDKGYAHPFIIIEKLTEELMKAEKKSYEKVIRVISHEVNNTMAGVDSLLSTAAAIIDDDTADKTEIAEMLQVCEDRCKSLSRFITSFAEVVKIPDGDFRPVDLNEAVERWRVMFESICAGRDIKLIINTCPGTLPVMIDTVLFEQVLINIVKNSAESIGDRQGTISIETSRTPDAIIITDNGEGISEDTAGKLFNPFFSTKANGQGIGLLFTGEVLHKHNCRFSLSTDPDTLTRFRIFF